jgi:hypothetical protein
MAKIAGPISRKYDYEKEFPLFHFMLMGYLPVPCPTSSYLHPIYIGERPVPEDGTKHYTRP